MAGAGSRGVRAVAVLAWAALVAQLALAGWQLQTGRAPEEVLLWAAAGPVPTLLVAALATVLGPRPAVAPSGPAAADGRDREEQDGEGQDREGHAGELVAPERRPSWAPDEASGAVWSTAGEAARGAEATRWGTPGSARDWAPAPRADPGSGTGQEQEGPRQ